MNDKSSEPMVKMTNRRIRLGIDWILKKGETVDQVANNFKVSNRRIWMKGGIKKRYMKNGFGNWYTCLLYQGMEPTNNLGEQAMREHVILRKIILMIQVRSERDTREINELRQEIARIEMGMANGIT